MLKIMKQPIRAVAAILLAGSMVTACGDFGNLNIDPKSPTEVEAVFLVSSAQKSLADHLVTSSVNQNVTRLLTQYWAQVTYTSESRYDLQGRALPETHWNVLYLSVLKDLQEARGFLNELDPVILANQEATISILEVYAFQMLVDLFGNVPYSEALQGENGRSPAYDDAATIYADLVTRLDAAINSIDQAEVGFSGDLMYFGDMSKWYTFAQSLKLRLGMRLAEISPATAQTIVEAAALNVMASNADNAELAYGGGTTSGNPLYADLYVSGRHDYVISAPFLAALEGVNDPRIPYYMDPVPDTTIYVGATYGNPNSIVWYEYAQVDASMSENAGFPSVYMDYAEVQSLLAEAATYGWATPWSAQQHYDSAIVASIEWWGGTEAEAATYLADAGVDFALQADPLQAIAFQRWIGFYNNPWQGYIEMRRMDYPSLNDILTPPLDMSAADFPNRFAYPVREGSVNGTNYTAAGTAIGGDTFQNRVFWDMN